MKYAGNLLIFMAPGEDEFTKVYDSPEELFADYDRLGMKFESPTEIVGMDQDGTSKSIKVSGTSWKDCKVVE